MQLISATLKQNTLISLTSISWIRQVCGLAFFPGPTQISVAISTASNEKLGGALERGYLWLISLVVDSTLNG